MSPVTHFLIGWVTANGGAFNRRERIFIALAGVIPDVDGLGLIVDWLTNDPDHTLWSKYHHVLGHNLFFGLIIAAIIFFCTQRPCKTGLFVLLSFHLHLFCDLIGSRSPDGYQWPIPYFAPLANAGEFTWRGQWELNAWPNFVITLAVLALTFFLAWQRGYSPLEMVSRRADQRLVATLRQRFARQ